MNNEEFVEVVKTVVVNGSIKAVKSVLKDPPGRQPLQQVVAMSKWYNELNENDKAVVEQIIKKAVDMAVFNFFCVLDGVSAIENENKGELKLYYENKDVQVLLNDPEKEYLHDLFNVQS
jgi:hypothetical protein